MEQLSTALLRPGEAERIVAGHPWIYAGSIQRLTHPAQDGDVVQVKDSRQRFLGVGFYNSQSKIAVRLLDPERVSIDEAFFASRVADALAHRKKQLPQASSFRVVNAESDFLSGLIVDKYEDVLVLQASSLGMDRRLEMIARVLQQALTPRAILERNDIGSRKFEGLGERQGTLWGDAPGQVILRLNGLEFEADLSGGHKTGFYLDQQVNYELVSRFAPGMNVLDCFTFQGGFALHAARASAARVLALDQSQDALAVAARNARRNGLADVCAFEAGNVFDWLKQHGSAAPNEKVIPRYDLIILDPPSFTRTRSAIGDALRGYKEIHLRALKLLKRGGTLATFCCSHHIDSVTFQEVILEAAFDARRLLRRVATYTQSPDHPVIPSIPETEYLKGFAFEVAR